MTYGNDLNLGRPDCPRSLACPISVSCTIIDPEDCINSGISRNNSRYENKGFSNPESSGKSFGRRNKDEYSRDRTNPLINLQDYFGLPGKGSDSNYSGLSKERGSDYSGLLGKFKGVHGGGKPVMSFSGDYSEGSGKGSKGSYVK